MSAISRIDSERAAPPIATPETRVEWHGTGRNLLLAMLHGIAEARASVELETYIFSDSNTGRRFREALVLAVLRGVRVAVLVDGFGSLGLPAGFFDALTRAGGSVKWFNRPSARRWAFRDHRKLLIIDRERAFVGGCNIADEYDGDGVTVGWRDSGVMVTGHVAAALSDEFQRQWQRADLPSWKLMRGRRAHGIRSDPEVSALLIKPGFGRNPLRALLRKDLMAASDIAITTAYFLPPRRLRMQIARAGRRGARVRLLLAGKSDVPLMLLASQSLYRGLLRRGVEIFEYAPQILHAKILVLDDVVYVGSANLDPRSLLINFEVMLRVKNSRLAGEVRAQFEQDLQRSERVTNPPSPVSIHWWKRLKCRLAYFILARVDPWIARTRLRQLD